MLPYPTSQNIALITRFAIISPKRVFFFPTSFVRKGAAAVPRSMLGRVIRLISDISFTSPSV